ncbi:glycoside hydrolase family 9 protein [Cellvibrio mixtus]|uniref:glycoside hydrolase family 9 protein n=1 Tax=Cellvibrio mixtus TaxID=39650 RepID=UPI000587B379|nr:glycoside hydrolase family 9 protein [Cellvibrio mixtus]
MKKKISSRTSVYGLKKLTALMSAILMASAINVRAEEGNPRVNQIGYFPNSPKIAVYKTSNSSAQSWQLTQNGVVVASGLTAPYGIDGASGDNVHRIDLTSVIANGDGLVLKVGADTSYPFRISTTALNGAFYDALKYFYHNRSGIAIEIPYTAGGSYAANSKWARPAGHLNAGANKGDNNVPCWTGTCNYSLNVTKGWYDAGDHGKYVVNGGISVWTLLNMHERSVYSNKDISTVGAFKLSNALVDNSLNIPESGNGVSDLLDEARWQLEFLLAMQVPAGQVKAGMVHHKVHDVGWTGLPLAPHEDGQQRALVPPSTAATLNVAATGAQCARIWKNIDAAFAATCLTAAERAWTAAQANPADIYSGAYDNGGGGYGDKTVADDFYWAAAELYITTGNSKYLSTINNYTITRTDFNWADTELPGLMSLALVPTEHTSALRTAAQQKIISIADIHLVTQNQSGYLVPLSNKEFYWGSNSGVTNKLMLVGLAYDFTGNAIYAEGVIKGLDYLLGRNTLSTSFVTGAGTKTVTQPHHRFWAGALNANYPWAPPGALSGGPNAGLEDDVSASRLSGCTSRPATCWIDSIDAWSTNEITINWNAPYAWLLGFANEYAGGTTQTNSSSSFSSSSVIRSSSSRSSIVPGSSSRSSIATSSSSSSVASSRSSSSVVSGQQCNWYGTLYPLCVTTTNGWGYENNKSCISRTTCAAQPAPFGIVVVTPSSVSTSSASSIATTSSVNSTSSRSSSSAIRSSVSSSVLSSSRSSSSSAIAVANCQYVISNEWNTGFTAAIRIKNNGTSVINGWVLNWNFTDGSRITSSWNATLSGSNPYSATNLSWNGTIPPGQTIEFGVQGSKGSSSAQIPVLSGSVCQP